MRAKSSKQRCPALCILEKYVLKWFAILAASLISVLFTTILLMEGDESLAFGRRDLIICHVFRELDLCLSNILLKYVFFAIYLILFNLFA